MAVPWVMDGHSHKVVAVALKDGRLVGTSRRGGVRSASLTPAVRYYVDNGAFTHASMKNPAAPALKARCCRSDPRSVSEGPTSGRRDLNPRPPAPKAGALPSCATSRLEDVLSLAGPRPSPPYSEAANHHLPLLQWSGVPRGLPSVTRGPNGAEGNRRRGSTGRVEDDGNGNGPAWRRGSGRVGSAEVPAERPPGERTGTTDHRDGERCCSRPGGLLVHHGWSSAQQESLEPPAPPPHDREHV